MTRSVQIDSQVYAAADGTVAFLDVPEGIIPPPYIAHLTLLGPGYNLFTTAVNHLRDQQVGRGAGQQALAAILGTLQQNISRWVNAETAPRMSDEQWAKLVHVVHAAQASREAPGQQCA
jgi:hypothetical protein